MSNTTRGLVLGLAIKNTSERGHESSIHPTKFLVEQIYYARLHVPRMKKWNGYAQKSPSWAYYICFLPGRIRLISCRRRRSLRFPTSKSNCLMAPNQSGSHSARLVVVW